MTSNTVKVALVGCGRIAGHHARSIVATDGVELAAVCDLAQDKAKAYGDEFAVPFYTDYRKMLSDHPDVAVVAVITPSGMHFEHGMEMMERWGKHIILEKPTMMRPEQLTKAWATADRLNLSIFPVFQNRHNKAVRRVKQALETGELGEIRIMSVRVRWCRPQRYYDLAPWRGTFSHDGGALTNQGIHHVDLLRHLGGEVDKVSATMRTLGAAIEVEDTVVATLSYATKAVGVLEVTTAARPDDFEASISIVGEKGLAQIGGIAVNELQVFTPEPAACAAHSEDFKGIEGHGAVYGFGHAQMYRDIAAAFHQSKPYPVDREDCMATIRLLHAFYRSDEASGGWVSVDSPEQSARLGRPNEAISDRYRTPEHA
ncbi:gfo/Idh/MocA family oxidoreductase [Paramagnetospirillum kuznetsovii]|uniref:Gfo/Idh/MocA family oxidoreductase n=1 Tax=Paramagnetospirillum kuznetsovii TaxID=2053833 RepID=A0A364P2M4_9PROT|nr:Gfo/Idh/MocA family oxidoreductase [Paramagnetospirillum kuznetsovii]RAU23584.1 gfo/Idh/MocA family oxidoreductase [Paramagnetospirillum kuznetsovii]